MYQRIQQVALVTGGSRGIGEAIVRRLAADGAAVAFTYLSSSGAADDLAAGIAAHGGRALAIRADSADPAALRAAVGQTVSAFGRLDILVNSAGILKLGLVDDVALEDFDRMMAVNVRAPFAAVQAALPHLQSGGRIVTIGSVTADRTAIKGGSVYATTKAALAAMVRSLALDLAARGITINNVQPGPTETDMNPADGPHAEWIKAAMPVGRSGQPSEIAGLVAYLVRAEAAFITGSSITMDGGYTA